MSRKSPVNYLAVISTLALSKTEGVRNLNEDQGIARATFNKAIDHCEAAGAASQAKTLTNLRNELCPAGEGGGGRVPPVQGETRDYKVQQLMKDGEAITEPFIRLPVALLGKLKGGTATVTFNDGDIKVA